MPSTATLANGHWIFKFVPQRSGFLTENVIWPITLCHLVMTYSYRSSCNDGKHDVNRSFQDDKKGRKNHKSLLLFGSKTINHPPFNMSIVIICNERYAKNWSKALKEKLPTEEIEIYPHISDYKKVEFAAVWNAPAGVLSEFPNLKAVQSLGAGVKHIFDGQQLNDNISIARIIDPQLLEDMWEYCLMLSLNYLKNTRIYFQKELKKEWKELRYKNIKDVTVSFLGLGKIGSLMANKFSQIGFNVWGWSNSEKSIIGVKSYFGKIGLEKMLGETRIF